MHLIQRNIIFRLELGLLFHMQSQKLHMLLLGLLTLYIFFCFLFILLLNSPFDGILQLITVDFRYALYIVDTLPR